MIVLARGVEVGSSASYSGGAGSNKPILVFVSYLFLRLSSASAGRDGLWEFVLESMVTFNFFVFFSFFVCGEDRPEE